MKKIIALLIILTMCVATITVFADSSAPYADANGTKTNAIVDAANAKNFDQFNAIFYDGRLPFRNVVQGYLP